jgi:hypothetical protein
MQGVQCGYQSITATRLSDGHTVTRKLRYGWGSFNDECDEGCTSTWGQICLKSSDTNGQVGGYQDFPQYATYAHSNVDHCSRSDQVHTTTACSASRRFAIYVR